MELSRKQKTFPEFSSAFLKSKFRELMLSCAIISLLEFFWRTLLRSAKESNGLLFEIIDASFSQSYSFSE